MCDSYSFKQTIYSPTGSGPDAPNVLPVCQNLWSFTILWVSEMAFSHCLRHCCPVLQRKTALVRYVKILTRTKHSVSVFFQISHLFYIGDVDACSTAKSSDVLPAKCVCECVSSAKCISACPLYLAKNNAPEPCYRALVILFTAHESSFLVTKTVGEKRRLL